jgi:hypothetical protein
MVIYSLDHENEKEISNFVPDDGAPPKDDCNAKSQMVKIGSQKDLNQLLDIINIEEFIKSKNCFAK